MRLFKLFKKVNYMRIFNTPFAGIKKIQGINHYDNRGFFREIFKNKFFQKKKLIFLCMSKSKKKVVRGLHFQRKIQQDLFVSVIKGKIFDVVLDLRKKSKTFGKHYSTILSEKNATSLFVPGGFAHGFCALETENIILYGLTNYRSKNNEVGILWNDKKLKIKCPIKKPILSKKDKKNIRFSKYEKLYL